MDRTPGRDLGIKRDLALLFLLAILLWLLHITWLWKIVLFVPLGLLIVVWPLLALTVSHLRGMKVTKQEVLLVVRAHVWLTVPELQAELRKKKQRPISLLEVMSHIYALKKEGVLEGRERQPPEPAFFSEGNIWEYHRKM
ncbi:MAG: hypothetical protein HY092_00810 [Candidatus Kerfeldbacteria bacterium]|nr:hypothetical protein [Candidatus Kerfeldbacteria bacterium]